MALIADILMAAGSFGAAIYCYVLSGRLKKFTALESGMGGAIAVLSVQVDDMTRALEKARLAATGSATNLESQTLRGEQIAARLELLVAAMHDLPDPANTAPEPVAGEADRKLRFVRRRPSRQELEAAE
jgi:hypothetical protein